MSQKLQILKKQLGVGRSGINKFENHISIKMIHENILKYFQKALNFS